MGQAARITGAGARSARPAGRVEGFTLIEIMIVVAIVAVLASIAYSSYTNQVIQSRRATAASCLVEVSQVLERRYTASFDYSTGAVPNLGCMTDLANFYTFNINRAQRNYTLAAVPIGIQARDNDRCGTLGVNQSGVKTVSGPYPLDQCW